MAEASGFDQYQLAFGFLKARAGELSTVLVGSTSPDHLRRNLESLDAPALSEDLVCALSKLAPPTVDRP
jgi:aryl-alcohol dehydrogenase-like predicted oxidoreductase